MDVLVWMERPHEMDFSSVAGSTFFCLTNKYISVFSLPLQHVFPFENDEVLFVIDVSQQITAALARVLRRMPPKKVFFASWPAMI